MNGLNGVNGIMNGHSEYAVLRCAEELRRRKGEAMNYARYRCAQFVPPNGYHQLPPNHFYPNDVGRYGPVGTRVMPDIDRFNGYPRYSPSSLSQRTLIDAQVDPARMDLFHNPSFHPHSPYLDRTAGRSPHVPADSVAEVSWCCFSYCRVLAEIPDFLRVLKNVCHRMRSPSCTSLQDTGGEGRVGGFPHRTTFGGQYCRYYPFLPCGSEQILLNCIHVLPNTRSIPMTNT